MFNFLAYIVCLIIGFIAGFCLMLFFAERRQKWDRDFRAKNAALVRQDQLETVYGNLSQREKIAFRKEIQKFLNSLD